MFIGHWVQGYNYNRGDIVCCLSAYYVCSTNHISDNLTFPNYEDLHWIPLMNFEYTPFLSPFTTGTLTASPSVSLPPLAPLVTANPEGVTANPEGVTANPERVSAGVGPRPAAHETSSSKLKRKLEEIESQIETHKKRTRSGDSDIASLRDQLLLLKLDIATKTMIIDKYDNAKKSGSSDYAKTVTWLKTVSRLPFNRYKPFPVTVDSDTESIIEFFHNVRERLDKHILGLEPVKDEIMQFLARKITNPHSKGHVLALCGERGVGKTKIIRSLAEALDLPFYQINFGGLNDVNVITGHSETYVGSKPGKIVDILLHSGYMNPIVYLDEIDKMSESKSQELNGILTHLLDEEQNDKFQDNYLGNVMVNLSRVFFVIAFNDISKVDSIVSDRMTTIYVTSPSEDEKLSIAKTKVIPEILETVKMKCNVCIPDDVIRYVLGFTSDDPGVRQIKKNLERIIYKLNYDTLVNEEALVYSTSGSPSQSQSSRKRRKPKQKPTVVVTLDYVNKVLTKKNNDSEYYLSMYT